MTYYKQTAADAQKWTRCFRVEISNPLDGLPTVLFQEQDVVSIGGDTITKPGRVLQKTFDPNNGKIDLVNPVTGDVIGPTASHMQLYVLLHSLWYQTARENDDMVNGVMQVPVTTDANVTAPVETPQVDEVPSAE